MDFTTKSLDDENILLLLAQRCEKAFFHLVADVFLQGVIILDWVVLKGVSPVMKLKLLLISFLIFVVPISSFSYELPSDKLKHIAVSFSISLFLYPYVGYPENLIVTLGVGIGKEVYDLFSKTGHADMEDLIADLYGTALSVKELSNCANKKLCIGVVWVF